MCTNIREYVMAVMDRLGFDGESCEELSASLDRILNDEASEAEFRRIIGIYEENVCYDAPSLLEDMKALSASVGVHEYAGGLLLHLAMCEPLEKRYAEMGISEEIFKNSMKDLLYKNNECRLIKGMCGSFVCHWFYGFYKLIRFGIGRLQYQIGPLNFDYNYRGIELTKDTLALHVHIPRTGGPMTRSDVLQSYQMAKTFFAKYFPDKFENRPTVITCHSWLLAPFHTVLLSEKSNIRGFVTDFEMVNTGTYDNYGNAWRIFDAPFDGDLSKIPRDTSIRRIYTEKIEKGEPFEWGCGVFVI